MILGGGRFLMSEVPLYRPPLDLIKVETPLKLAVKRVCLSIQHTSRVVHLGRSTCHTLSGQGS